MNNILKDSFTFSTENQNEIESMKEVLYNRCIGVMLLECLVIGYLFLKLIYNALTKRANNHKYNILKFAMTYIRTNLVFISILTLIFCIKKIVSLIQI